ncbi:MAG: hypothetical protein KAW56_10580 [Candidatus Marinimicrobia bacterium]|nr:hypothetical protein [Candidatus Neomarinimicrobiota bacterium]
MKAKRIALVVPLIFTLGIIAFIGCSNDSLTSPVNQSINQGVPGDQINWIQWKPEVANRIKTILDEPRALAKVGYQEKIIYKNEGGTVGGDTTFGCQVTIPPHAFPEHERTIIVQVATSEEANAGVDFLPNQTFKKDVKITVSFEYLNINANADLTELNIYWLDDSTGLWVLVPDPEIDLENGAISVYVDHFTRYGWGL